MLGGESTIVYQTMNLVNLTVNVFAMMGFRENFKL